jgi:hypothetical protein
VTPGSGGGFKNAAAAQHGQWQEEGECFIQDGWEFALMTLRGSRRFIAAGFVAANLRLSAGKTSSVFGGFAADAQLICLRCAYDARPCVEPGAAWLKSELNLGMIRRANVNLAPHSVSGTNSRPFSMAKIEGEDRRFFFPEFEH